MSEATSSNTPDETNADKTPAVNEQNKDNQANTDKPKGFKRFLKLYSPKQSGILWSIVTLFFTVVILLFLLSIYWGLEPAEFDVKAVAEQRAAEQNVQLVVGYVTTNTLIEVAGSLLNKPGGYLSNDLMPPGILMDNIPSWEFGVLQQVRDFSKALRNDISRSQTLGGENSDLAHAEPQFNVDSTAWMFPSAEQEYAQGIEHLTAYLNALSDTQQQNAQFFSRADNLTDWLKTVSRRLGSLSQQLSASVGQSRLNTDLAGDAEAQRSTMQDMVVKAKTPWLEIDNVFYEARGTAWALLHLLRAIEVDFKEVLADKNAAVSLQQIVRELESTQRTVWSPMILNGSDFGLFSNHSLVMAAYISRANSGLIELRDLLQRG